MMWLQNLRKFSAYLCKGDLVNVHVRSASERRRSFSLFQQWSFKWKLLGVENKNGTKTARRLPFNFPNRSLKLPDQIRPGLVPFRTHYGHNHPSHHHLTKNSNSKLGFNNESDRERKDNGKEGEKIVKIGLASDVLLCGLKGGAGILSGSTAMIADAIHSLSDIALSAVSLWTYKVSQIPKDTKFPFGRGKIETMGALSVGLLLMGTSVGISWHALDILQSFSSELPSWISQILGKFSIILGHSHHHPHKIDLENFELALSVAVVSVGVKEGLYWATKSIGEKSGSQLLKANAWHHRSDAITSVMALVGIGGSLAGAPLLDPMAGLVVSGMIFKASFSIVSDSVNELVDIGLPETFIDPIRKSVSKVDGVQECPLILARKIGSSVHVEVTISVDPSISVAEAINITARVNENLEKDFPLILQPTILIGKNKV